MAVDVTPSNTRDKGKDVNIQRPKLAVYDFYSGTGNWTENFPHEMRELTFSNDSSGTITVQVIGPASCNITFILLAREVLNDQRLPAFTSLVITGVGFPWRFYVMSALVP